MINYKEVDDTELNRLVTLSRLEDDDYTDVSEKEGGVVVTVDGKYRLHHTVIDYCSPADVDDQDVYEAVNISTEMVLSEVEVARYGKAVEVLREIKDRFYGGGIMIDEHLSMDDLLEDYRVLGLLAEIDG